MKTNETHPWKWFAPINCETLVIGTFPTAKRNWSFDFFYPNRTNLFWPLMSKLSKKELNHYSGKEAIEERKEILASLKIAITDMGFEIVREDESSNDEKLTIINFMDIFQILSENPTINKIILTSSSGPVSAAKWFIDYLKSRNINHKFPKGLKPINSEIKFNDRLIKIAILYSPSKRAANRISFDKLASMYESEIQPQ